MLDRFNLPGPHSGRISLVESVGGDEEGRLAAGEVTSEQNHNAEETAPGYVPSVVVDRGQ